MIPDRNSYRSIVERALVEDLGFGDITTGNLLLNGEVGSAKIIIKEKGVIAGLPVAGLVFELLDQDIEWQQLVSDGTEVPAGQVLAAITGSLQAILSGERVALNFLQRLSAIATKTALFVEKVARYNVKILDTRKTTPNLRVLEKYAVQVGGGTNHRFGLFDAAMVKDNHIRATGSITNAVRMLRAKLPMTAKIEVEADTIEQVREALVVKADIIMLDNMSPEEISAAVKLIEGRAKVEASGGINLDNIVAIAAAGVDFISVGSLTHSVRSLDINLEL